MSLIICRFYYINSVENSNHLDNNLILFIRSLYYIQIMFRAIIMPHSYNSLTYWKAVNIFKKIRAAVLAHSTKWTMSHDWTGEMLCPSLRIHQPSPIRYNVLPGLCLLTRHPFFTYAALFLRCHLFRQRRHAVQPHEVFPLSGHCWRRLNLVVVAFGGAI